MRNSNMVCLNKTSSITATFVMVGLFTTAAWAQVATNVICVGCVGQVDIVNKAVGTAEIALGAVTFNRIADFAITGDKLGQKVVTTAKIDLGAVTANRLSGRMPRNTCACAASVFHLRNNALFFWAQYPIMPCAMFATAPAQ